MREIKFRGKIISDNKQLDGGWMTGYLTTITLVEGVKYFIEDFSDWGLNTKFEVDPKTVGQWTGLNDKNGVDIYEGDITINHKKYINKIVFKDGSFGHEVDLNSQRFGSRAKTSLTSNTFFDLRFSFLSQEVIGNIYENPELLEEQNQ